MIKDLKHLAVLLGIFLIIYSCEFSPSEIPMSEIEKPSDIAPPISIELNPSIDTLKLSSPVWINYTAKTGEQKLYRVEFTIDNETLNNAYSESENKAKALINPNYLENGKHELKITTYTATNTGSIADNIGAEQYWYEINGL
jgi:hypothetical protein